jgi:hypothetical protein
LELVWRGLALFEGSPFSPNGLFLQRPSLFRSFGGGAIALGKTPRICPWKNAKDLRRQ